MATTLNAFSALGQIGSAQAPSASKKKKSKKAKAPVGAQVSQDEGVPDAQGASQDAIVEVGEACAILDKTARTFKSGSDRLKLWKDWIKQACDRSSKAITYTDTDGSLLDFKQVVLRSRALEITVEGCLSSQLPPDHAPHLQQLLTTFLPRAADAPALANAIVRLAQLLAKDTQSYDTLGAAQRAAFTLVGSLKAEEAAPASSGKGAGGTPLDRLGAIDAEMSKLQGFLSKVSQGGVTKEHLNSARQLVNLQNEKLDLLHGAESDGSEHMSAARRAAAQSLEELKAAISNHLHEAQAQEAGAQGGGGKGARGSALASLQREEAVLAAQANKLAAEIRSLEAQLSALRAQAAEVEDQRQRLRQRQSVAREDVGGHARGKGPGLDPSHYLEEIAAANALLVVADPLRAAAASPELSEARAASADAPARFLGLVRQLLGLGLSALQETPSKITLARSRLTQADKLALLGSTSKDAAAKASKQREEGEKLLSEAMRAADAIAVHCAEAVESARRRMSHLARAAPDQAAALAPHARELEELLGHARAHLDVAAMVASGNAPAPAAPAPAPAQQPFALAPGGGRPVAPPAAAAPGPGPISPPVAASNGAAPAAAPPPSNGGPVPAPTPAAPKQQQEPRPRPATAAEALAAAPPDGFQQVGGKKGRRPRA